MGPGWNRQPRKAVKTSTLKVQIIEQRLTALIKRQDDLKSLSTELKDCTNLHIGKICHMTTINENDFSQPSDKISCVIAASSYVYWGERCCFPCLVTPWCFRHSCVMRSVCHTVKSKGINKPQSEGMNPSTHSCVLFPLPAFCVFELFINASISLNALKWATQNLSQSLPVSSEQGRYSINVWYIKLGQRAITDLVFSQWTIFF